MLSKLWLIVLLGSVIENLPQTALVQVQAESIQRVWSAGLFLLDVVPVGRRCDGSRWLLQPVLVAVEGLP